MTQDVSPLLLDRYLPGYDLAECHASIVDADAETTWQAVRHLDLSAIPVVQALLRLRAAPGRLKAIAAREPAPASPPFTLDDMPRAGFALLDERPGEIVFGTVSKPWKIGDEQGRTVAPAEFATFAEPGWTRIAFTIRTEPYGRDRTLVTTETRVATTDDRSRRRFAAYWKLAGPFSALIRRLVLGALRASLERPEPTGHAAGEGPPSARLERVRARVEHELDTRSVGIGVWLLRRTKGAIARPWRRRVLVLTTTGRRSGLTRVVPLQYFPDGDDLVVVAANSGMPASPGWYHNLIAHPAAEVEVLGRRRPVNARELTAEEAEAFWPRILQAAPDYARFARRTSRRIPLVRLVPADGRPGA